MNNRIILITGNSKGIGFYLTKYFLQNGDTVIGCSRSKSNLKHENYLHFKLDITKEIEVRNMFYNIKKNYNKLDVLINNAGIAAMNHILTTPLDTINNIFKTNYNGSFICTREASRLMMKNKFGRVINFSTVAVPFSLEGEAAYASSKSAIETLTKISAKELSNFGITVNAIGPSPINTDLIKTVPKDKIDKIINNQSIKRLGNFEDILNVLLFFIDVKSNFITGQVIYLGGVS